MITEETKVKPKSLSGQILYWIVVVIVIALLFAIAFTTLFRNEIAAQLEIWKETPIPQALAFMEGASYTITYVTWIAIATGILFLLYTRLQADSWYSWAANLAAWGLIESGESRDVRHGLRLGAEMAGLAAFTWVVLSPVPIVPGVVHLRTFAFVPGLVALLFGRGVGFLSGYLGSIIWALLAGYWIPTHTPVVDGVMVGALTGWVIAAVLRGRRSRDELLAYIESNRFVWLLKCAALNLVGGLAMSFFVGCSIRVTTGAEGVPFWMGFFTIGILSDTTPMVVFTAFLTEPMLRAVRRYTELPNF